MREGTAEQTVKNSEIWKQEKNIIMEKNKALGWNGIYRESTVER